MARRAGVSVATASNVLNGRGGTRGATAQLVVAAAEALNYRPDRAARALIARRSRASPPPVPANAPRLICLGYLSVDFTARLGVLPHRDDRVTAQRIRKTVGGPAANVAATAAGVGEPYPLKVNLVTVAGSDDDSDWAIERLAERGVGTVSIGTRSGGRLSRCVVLVEPHGSRTIINEPLGLDVPRAMARIEEEIVPGQCQAIVIEGFQYREAASRCADLRRRSALVAVHSTGLPPDLRTAASFIAMMGNADLVFVNRDVARDVTDFRGARIGLVDRVESLWRSCPEPRPILIFTLGDEGVVIWDRSQEAGLHIGARPVDPVDATGAGDCFAGIFLAAWLNGAPIATAGRLAVAGASLAVTVEGAQEGRPTAAELAARAGLGLEGTAA